MIPAKPKKPPSRQNDRNLSECKLLDAAQQTFVKLGFNASTTRMIAAAAGVNLALINKYFGNKEGLLLSLIERRKNLAASCSLGYPAQEDFQSELIAHYDYLLDIHESMGRVMMKIVVSKSLTDECFQAEIRSRMTFVSIALLERLENLKKLGKLPSDVDVRQIEEQVRGYFQAQAFFGSILLGEDLKIIRKKLHCFAETLARAYTPRA